MSSGNERDKGQHKPADSGKALPIARAITVTDERIDSRDLFAVGRQIAIIHGTDTYSLRLTAQNKLILTK
jgi:hemin uptake protein HemP